MNDLGSWLTIAALILLSAIVLFAHERSQSTKRLIAAIHEEEFERYEVERLKAKAFATHRPGHEPFGGDAPECQALLDRVEALVARGLDIAGGVYQRSIDDLQIALNFAWDAKRVEGVPADRALITEYRLSFDNTLLSLASTVSRMPPPAAEHFAIVTYYALVVALHAPVAERVELIGEVFDDPFENVARLAQRVFDAALEASHGDGAVVASA